MEEKIKKLLEDYSDLKIEKRQTQVFEDEPIRTYFDISGFKGKEQAILIVRDDEDYDLLEKIVSHDFTFTNELFGVEYDDRIELAIEPINIRTRNVSRMRMRDKIVEFDLNYYGNKLNIQIQFRPDKDISESSCLLSMLNELLRGYRRPAIMTISNFKKPTIEGKDNDIRNILNSVLFDFTYTYNLAFEPLSFDSLERKMTAKRFRPIVPTETLSIIFKKYIPELIEYFNIAEKVDYAPFKFICYFHIVEYFSDKSAYYHAAEKLKSLMLKPDFHLKTDKYVNQAINFFKIEAQKNTSDKIKIRRVIAQFIDRQEFEEYLKDIEAYDYFTNPISIQCSKNLELKAIDFSSDSKFQETLMNRIYTMRCSIVHSNPDFDETKAVPFSPTNENMDKLRKEIDMIYEVARVIIIESRGE